jgi:hypothetical protein
MTQQIDIYTLTLVVDFIQRQLDSRAGVMSALPNETADFQEQMNLLAEKAKHVGYAECCRDLSTLTNSLLAQAEMVITGAKPN